MLQKPETAPTGSASDFRVKGGSAWKARKMKPEPSTRIRWSPALIGAFAMGNPTHFHRPDGNGYELVAGFVIELNRLNPQVAARLASSFNFWRRYEEGRRKLMREQLQRIRKSPGLSRDVSEIVSKALDHHPKH